MLSLVTAGVRLRKGSQRQAEVEKAERLRVTPALSSLMAVLITFLLAVLEERILSDPPERNDV